METLLTLAPAARASVTYTSPASTSPDSTAASADLTSGSLAAGVTVMPAFAKTSAATTPHGTAGSQIATLTDLLARSSTDVILAGLVGGTATVRTFDTKSVGCGAAAPNAVMFFF